MIDLNAFKETTEEVKLFNGEIINLKKPTQQMIIDMMALQDDINKKDSKKLIEKVNKLLISILNHNAENKQFDIDYIKNNFTYETMLAFIKAYGEFANKINNQDF